MKMRRFQTDNGPELLRMIKISEYMAILSTSSSAYTLQSGGLGERMNRSFLDIAGSMLKHAGLSIHYSADETCCGLIKPNSFE